MSTRGKTSFQRKVPSKGLQINGTKVSSSNSQLLVSSGIPTLDHILGGGVAVGSVILIEEDLYGVYGKLLLKYWLAEGIVSGHEIFVCSADANPSDILSELPDPISYDGNVTDSGGKLTSTTNDQSEEDLKIAWRYKHLSSSQAGDSHLQFGHYFDVSKTMRSSLRDSANCTTFDPLAGDDFCKTAKQCYTELFRKIQCSLDEGNFSTNRNVDHKNILRIGLHSLTSAQWSHSDDHSCAQFLYALRMLMRTSYAVCLITVPTHLHQPSYTERLEHLVDSVICLDSFVGTKLEDEIAFKEYNGLLHVVKLPQLNSLTHSNINTEDLAFKLRRKRFTVEKFHLPPALPDSDFKPSTKTSQHSKVNCGGQLDQLVDF